MSRFVRASKFRHTFGTSSKRDQCYDNIRVSRNAWDTNLCKANSRYVSINLEAGGGGQFAVIPLDHFGKLPIDFPVYAGHTAAVLDTDFNPFNDNVIASCSEDCKVLVWSIPDELPKENITAPVCSFTGHNRKVGHVLFHPTAENVLLSSGADLVVKLYDIKKGVEVQEVTGHPDIINSIAWSYDGSMLATSCKDKNMRIIDPRNNKMLHSVASHQGVKGTRVCWLGDSDRILTTGFSKTSDRQYAVWDLKNMSEPLKTENLDTMSGGIIPYFDNDTKMLYMAGKGDGNIRYYEYVEEAPYVFPLSEYKSSDPQRGIAFLPKRSLNINDCEVARVFKVTPDRIEPISFKVPRKSDNFQADLFPDTPGDKAALSADEWLQGKNSKPILINLEKGFVATIKKDFVTDAVVSNDARDPLKNPGSEKEYQEAFHALRKEHDALKNELAQKEVRIRQLEVQLDGVSLGNSVDKKIQA